MKFGQLSNVFVSFAWKQLTAVEADATASNGHEFNSSNSLRAILGETTRRFNQGTGIPTRFLHFSDQDEEPIEASGFLSWYDSRKRVSTRSAEWRLYYTDNPVIGRKGRAISGDFMVVAFTAENQAATVFLAPSGSTCESQLRWLFGIKEGEHLSFGMAEVGNEQVVDMTRARILEAAGIMVLAEDETLLEKMLKKFGGKFPTTATFGKFVRTSLTKIRAEDDADLALSEWMEREEFAFRVLEKHIVEEKLKSGFADVDDFVKCSLSVQNRRKSRAGLAFENHLSEVFLAHNLLFERTAKVENNARPDFLFPGAAQYFNDDFPVELLTLLGAKTSCKDRWRQVLAEGPKVKEKHLVTLEPAISSNQLSEMREHKLQLVVPVALHATYPASERNGIWDVATFIDSVKSKQLKARI